MQPANGAWVGERIGLNPTHNNIGGIINDLRQKLVMLGINVSSRKGRKIGGYWLTDRASGNGVAVKVVR